MTMIKKYKRSIISLLVLLTATAFATEASALPVFARQTGQSCIACHFQHFPLLNTFGRSFKSSGYTWKGSQETVEGDGLSIPSTLNMAVLTSAGYEKNNSTKSVTQVKNTGSGVWFVPGSNGEASLFFGGRISDNAGFLAELGLGGAGAALASAKLPILFKVSSDKDKRAGIVFFSTDDQGSSYGFETLNTGANAVHQMSNTPGFNNAHTQALSAQQYINTAGIATGVSFVANGDMGFINLTKFNQVGITGTPATSPSGANSASLNSTYVRVAGSFNVKKWDTGVGIQSWSGSSANGTGARYYTKAFALDGQIQGALDGGTAVGFYASYARAPAVAPGASLGNTYNVDGLGSQGTSTRSSFNISGEAGVVPDKLILGLGIRRGKSGQAVQASANASDNAIFLTASYKLLQNMLARLSYTAASGDYWTSANKGAIGNRTTTINLFTLF
ncbi:MAG: hypothetical protein ACXVLQ_02460 [Bacteriovorax sp.]